MVWYPVVSGLVGASITGWKLCSAGGSCVAFLRWAFSVGGGRGGGSWWTERLHASQAHLWDTWYMRMLLTYPMLAEMLDGHPHLVPVAQLLASHPYPAMSSLGSYLDDLFGTG